MVSVALYAAGKLYEAADPNLKVGENEKLNYHHVVASSLTARVLKN